MRTQLLVAIGVLATGLMPLGAQSTSESFDQVVGGMHAIRWYAFGTGSGSTISNLSQLSQSFNPFGIADQTVTHQEWERYQYFNSTNFQFSSNALNLTATLAGGVYPGGIHSGQIWSKETFQPDKTGYNTYAFMVRMKVPNGQGSWPGFWLYTQQPGEADGSEIDDPEFSIMKWQNQYDWTGYDHGPGAGGDIYSIKSNPWTWRPGIDFSADYHNYELVWTPYATYKYVDSRLIEAQNFTWTAPGAPQFGINLAVGSSDTANLPGLQPNSSSEFPMQLSIQYICIWAK